jgi:cytosine/adenosine deaminase-related metal-dependent hydrolase
VIDVDTGRARPDMTVVAGGPRISVVAPASSATIPSGSRIVGGHRKFLIPGLWNMHVHRADFVKVYSLLPREAFFAIMDEAAKAALRWPLAQQRYSG